MSNIRSDFHNALGIHVAPPKGRGTFWAIPCTAGFEEIGSFRVYADGTSSITPYQGVIEPQQAEKLRAAVTHALYGPATIMYGTWREVLWDDGELDFVETVISVPRISPR